MKKWIINIIMFVTMILCLSACQKSTYVPENEITFGIEEGTTGMDDSGRSSYDSTPHESFLKYTSNGAEIYALTGAYQYKVDLSDGTFSYLCDQLECEHNDNDCEMLDGKVAIRCYKDGILFTRGDSLYYREADGKINQLFTNETSTDYALEFEKNPYDIYGIIFINENDLLLFGVNYVFTYNLQTNESGKIMEISKGPVTSNAYLNGKLYSTISGGELFVMDLGSGKSQKLADQGIRVKVYGDGIAYCKWNEGICSIYSNNQEFNDEKLLIEDVQPDFHIFGDDILYTDDSVIYICENGCAKVLCDAKKLEYEYARLPIEYQNDDINRPNAKLGYCLYFYYEQGNLLLELVFDVYDENGYPCQLYTYYLVDENGEVKYLELR